MEALAWGYGLVEGPTFAPDGSVYFSDVLGGGVHRLSPGGDVETVIPKRRGVGGMCLHADGGLVVSGRDVVHAGNGTVLSDRRHFAPIWQKAVDLGLSYWYTLRPS